MGKTHYTGGYDDEIEQAPCGTWIGEDSSVTGFWDHVNCGRCLAQREKIINGFAEMEEIIINQMGGMADHYNASRG